MVGGLGERIGTTASRRTNAREARPRAGQFPMVGGLGERIGTTANRRTNRNAREARRSLSDGRRARRTNRNDCESENESQRPTSATARRISSNCSSRATDGGTDGGPGPRPRGLRPSRVRRPKPLHRMIRSRNILHPRGRSASCESLGGIDCFFQEAFRMADREKNDGGSHHSPSGTRYDRREPEETRRQRAARGDRDRRLFNVMFRFFCMGCVWTNK
jgi:hypothetical protein